MNFMFLARADPLLGIALTVVAVLLIGFVMMAWEWLNPKEDKVDALAELGDVNALAAVRVRAKKGDASAQFTLGKIYEDNRVVSKDDVEAVKWYRKAADQGLAKAQVVLGEMYADGRGVPKDDVEAVKWYRKAAEKDDVDAKWHLGLMYQYGGDGVPEDETEAYKWYLLAGAQGSVSAHRSIGMIEDDLTPAQRAEGQRLAREWKPKA